MTIRKIGMVFKKEQKIVKDMLSEIGENEVERAIKIQNELNEKGESEVNGYISFIEKIKRALMKGQDNKRDDKV